MDPIGVKVDYNKPSYYVKAFDVVMRLDFGNATLGSKSLETTEKKSDIKDCT